MALGGLAALVVASLGFSWHDLWLTWCRRGAAEACLDPRFDVHRRMGLLGPHWGALLEAREAAAYPHLASLLKDPRRRVWQRTATAIDAWPCGGEAFAAHLRRTDRLAALRYTFGEPCGPTRRYLDGGWWLDAPLGCWTISWERVWNGSTGDPVPPFAAGIDFLEQMVLCRDRGGGADGNELEDREDREDRDAEAGTEEESAPGVSAERWQLAKRVFSHPWSLTALAYLDHPAALVILERLRQEAPWRDAIDRILERPPPIAGLGFPSYRPLEHAVSRLLDGDKDERALAAAFAVEADLREAAPRLRQALAEESDPEQRLFYEASLLALGDGSRRERIREALVARLRPPAERAPQPGLLPPRFEVWFSLLGELTYLPQHLARSLLLAGDLETVSLMALQGDEVGLHLEDFVDGLPRELLDDERYALGCLGVVTGSSQGNGYPESLAEWWHKVRPSVTWDAARRRFVVTRTNG